MMFGPPADALARVNIVVRNIFLIGTFISGTVVFLGCKGLKYDKAVGIIGIILGALTFIVNVAIVVFVS